MSVWVWDKVKDWKVRSILKNADQAAALAEYHKRCAQYYDELAAKLQKDAIFAQGMRK